MKRMLLALLAVVTVVAAAISPYSIPKTLESYSNLTEATERFADVKADTVSAKNSVVRAQSEFDDARSFEVSYGDIERLEKVLNSVAVMNVASITNVDARQQFKSTTPYQDGERPSAIKFSLVAEDTTKALAVLNKCELPIYSLYIKEPNMIDVVFLTGGGIE